MQKQNTSIPAPMSHRQFVIRRALHWFVWIMGILCGLLLLANIILHFMIKWG